MNKISTWLFLFFSLWNTTSMTKTKQNKTKSIKTKLNFAILAHQSFQGTHLIKHWNEYMKENLQKLLSIFS